VGVVTDQPQPGAVSGKAHLASVSAGLVSALAGLFRALPFERGKVRLTGWIPLDHLARSGHFQGRVFRGLHGILWDASTLPDMMTRSMFWSGSYQDDVLACFALAIRPGDVVFDIGAHYGLMTVYASKLTGDAGKVVAFEPSPRNREVLLHHCRINHCGNVMVEGMGLLDKPGEFDFYMTTRNSWNSSFDASFASQHSHTKTTVAADTLDAYVERTGLQPSLLKIDTEGTEQECLIGGERTLRTLQPVIVIEYNSLSQARPGHDEKRMLHLLRDLGYRMFVPKLNFWRKSMRRFQEMAPDASLDNALINVLCLPPTRPDLVPT
jgi:FkbM family methyltransferase